MSPVRANISIGCSGRAYSRLFWRRDCNGRIGKVAFFRRRVAVSGEISPGLHRVEHRFRHNTIVACPARTSRLLTAQHIVSHVRPLSAKAGTSYPELVDHII